MSAPIIRFPPIGWCVRRGSRCAHWLLYGDGRATSLCGAVERVDAYTPQRLRPLQGQKPRCPVCEVQHVRMSRKRRLG